MAFAWERMDHTPEGEFGRREARKREQTSLDVITNTYWTQAEKMLSGRDSNAVRDEAGRFAQNIVSAREGAEQDELINNLFNALRLRKVEIPDGIENKRERAAFAVALSRACMRSLQ